MTSSPGEAAAPALTEGQIAQAIAAAFDVRVGYLALDKSPTPGVRDMANALIKDHLDMADEQAVLLERHHITPVATELSVRLTDGGNTRREQLATYDGAEFDRQFADVEVLAHRLIADTVENTLIPASITPDYRDFLVRAAATLRRHQRHAEHLVAELAGT